MVVTKFQNEMCCGFCRVISSTGGWVFQRGQFNVMVWLGLIFHIGGSLGVLCSFCLLFLSCLLCPLTDPGSPGFDHLIFNCWPHALVFRACSGRYRCFGLNLWNLYCYSPIFRWLQVQWVYDSKYSFKTHFSDCFFCCPVLSSFAICELNFFF